MSKRERPADGEGPRPPLKVDCTLANVQTALLHFVGADPACRAEAVAQLAQGSGYTVLPNSMAAQPEALQPHLQAVADDPAATPAVRTAARLAGTRLRRGEGLNNLVALLDSLA